MDVRVYLFGKPVWELPRLEGSYRIDAERMRSLGAELKERLERAADVITSWWKMGGRHKPK